MKVSEEVEEVDRSQNAERMREEVQRPCTSPSLAQKYMVIHKSVKHLKNSQQIHHSTDHGSSYADRERETVQVFFFTYFTDAQCVHLW